MLTGKTIGQLTYLETPTPDTLIPVELSGATYHIDFSAITSNSTVEVTYSELVDKITGETLNTGSYYIITDFRTCYDQPDFNSNGGEIIGNNYKEANVEPIIVFATSTNTISSTAYQPTYPNDRIQYDWTFSATERTQGVAYGRISERIDEFNNRTDYDHRTILFKRYEYIEINFDSPYQGVVEVAPTTGSTMNVNGTGTNFTGLTIGQYVGFKLGGDFRVYEITSISGNTLMTITGLTNVNTGCCVEMFPANGQTNTSYLQNNITTAYTEYYTFDYNDFNVNNYVGNYANSYVYDENSFILANNVFQGSTYRNNTFGDMCYNNSFDDDCENNTIGNYFYNNITDDDFDGNLIGNWFSNNRITSNFQYNRIGENFQYNYLVQNDFYRNNIMNRFEDNIISGNDFQNNEIGSGFNNNVIRYSQFYKNDIGNGYNYNKVYSDFYGNLIGNGFNDNDLYCEFFDNTIGEYYENNTIGLILNPSSIQFYSNKIGNSFFSNDISGDTSNNVIGEQFENNTIYSDFNDNKTSNEFKGNMMLGSFESNNIDSFVSGNQFSGNTYSNNIGTYTYDNDFLGSVINNDWGSSFNNNTIGINFNNNFIGNDSNFNTIGENFYGNNIGFDFNDNIIGDDFYGNNIQSNFYENTIGDGFQTNQIGGYFNNNTIGDGFGYGYGAPQGNKIGSNFYNNTVGEYFYNNSIPDNFRDNTLGDYFQWNVIDTDINAVDFTPNYGNITAFTYTALGTGTTDGIYTNLSGATSGHGVNASFNIEVSGNTVIDVTGNTSGKLYQTGNTITIPGSQIGGVTGVISGFTTNKLSVKIYKPADSTYEFPDNETEMDYLIDNSPLFDTYYSPNIQGVSYTTKTGIDQNQYGMVIDGYIQIPSGDTYYFGLSSDDGSDAFINGVKVADWYGAHGDNGNVPGGNQYPISLTAGTYPIKVRLQERSGQDIVILLYSLNSGSTWNIIPNSWFPSSVTGTTGSYPNIVAQGGNGENSTFNVDVIDGLVDSVVLNQGGSSYSVGNVLTISGTTFGSTEDITITVDSVYSDDIIVTVTGVGPNPSVYEHYTCQIFERQGGSKRLSFYDSSDILTITNINE